MIDELVQIAAASEVAKAHTTLPGVIVRYTAATQRADVQPGVLGTRIIDGEPVNYRLPLVTDAPVAWPGAAGYRDTWPLEEGDECLILCSERSLEQWKRTGGPNNEPVVLRRFDLSDAVILPMPTSAAQTTDQTRDNARVLSVPGGADIYLVDRDAPHPVGRGDIIQDVAERVLSILRTAGPFGNLGVPVEFSTDLTGTDGVTVGGIGVVTAAMEATVVPDIPSDRVFTE